MKALTVALILALVAAPGLAQTKKNSFSDADFPLTHEERVKQHEEEELSAQRYQEQAAKRAEWDSKWKIEHAKQQQRQQQIDLQRQQVELQKQQLAAQQRQRQHDDFVIPTLVQRQDEPAKPAPAPVRRPMRCNLQTGWCD